MYLWASAKHALVLVAQGRVNRSMIYDVQLCIRPAGRAFTLFRQRATSVQRIAQTTTDLDLASHLRFFADWACPTALKRNAIPMLRPGAGLSSA